ncbi:MAG: hypothetical protein LBJ23_05085 [Tannerella sp.]|jgi:hypothetical protein|nr:hypothetical protein [Tannerella sp.]
MKKRILYIIAPICLAFITITLHGQTDSRQKFDRQEFMTKRNAYITAEAKLTAEEAVEFIPLENQMKDKLFEIGHECRKQNRELRSKKSPSDEMYLKLVDCNIETRLKEAQLEKEYYDRFKKILSPEKLYNYQQAEFKFMREFMGDQGDPRRARNGDGNMRERKRSGLQDKDL